MLVLVLDASTPAVTVGVAEVPAGAALEPREALPAVRTVASRVIVDARAHAELLSSLVCEAVAEAGATMSDLAAVVAGVGPGPYTGLRVGIVSAAAFADALGAPAYGVCSLDGIGLAVRRHGTVVVATDARRKEVYWARYVDGQRHGEAQVDRPGELAALLGRSGGVDAVAGSGARMYSDVLPLPLLDVDHPRVDALAAVAAARIDARAPSEALAPLYLRKPDAQEPTGRAKSTLGS